MYAVYVVEQNVKVKYHQVMFTTGFILLKHWKKSKISKKSAAN